MLLKSGLIHRVVYVIFTFFHITIHQIKILTQLIMDRVDCIFRSKSEDYGFSAVSNYVRTVAKVPVHLAVIIGNEKPSCKSITNIIIWASAAGISQLTLYDTDGWLKNTNADLKLVLQKMGNIGNFHVDNIKWRSSIAQSQARRLRGDVGNRRLIVNLFSVGDSRQVIVNAANDIYSLITRGEVKEADINVALINATLDSSFRLPDVNLALVIGKACVPYGFFPWHIRYTEFWHVLIHETMKVEDFIASLKFYANCQQRYGK